MIIKETRFIKSSPGIQGCPSPDLPEYAFIGRSNVGKSSLLNMLTGKKRLAKTSSTPGKTRLINHFLINKQWYLVDLPGYGYAKVPKVLRKNWEKSTSDYILKRVNLMCLFLLIDSRISPQESDLRFLGFLGANRVPFLLLFTKTDKLSKNVLETNLAFYRKELKKGWSALPEMLSTSAETGQGKEKILSLIEDTNKLWKNNS